ncbi:MAG: hypothetical protein KAI66_26070, partial [Lentisphaeria bacterium]|nr:hypothetical protein [Lentisphaeria bacterium]
LAGVVGVGFVGCLLWMRYMQPTGSPVAQEEDRPVFDTSIESTPIAEFLRDTEGLRKQMDDLVGRFDAGEDDEEILRGGAASVARLKEWRKRMPKPAPVHFGRNQNVNALAIKEFGFVVLMGQRQDYSNFGMYFVKEGDGLRLDWEASEGFSEVLPGEIPALTDREPRMMRVLVNGSNFYTDPYPQERYQCYTLQHRDPVDYVWGFAERGSEVDLRLRERALRADLWGREHRAIVKVRRGGEGSRPNQVEVVEVLAQEWIVP